MFLTPVALAITAALLTVFAILTVAEVLNLRALAPRVPPEFEDLYDADSYAKSQTYTRVRTRFGWLEEGFQLLLLLAFWQLGGFGWLDAIVRDLSLGPIASGLVFIGGLGLAAEILSLPFAAYSTFVIEERFGFNRTNVRTFVLDLLKSAALAVVLGSVLLAAILAFFEWAGGLAWLYAWIAVACVSLVLSFVAPTWILPLFNKFTPLEDGDLRRAIFRYAERVDYPLTNIFVIDGSRRSSKANAFFTGFGKNKRIALYDTLVEKHSVDELVGVMAHEIGHYKKSHIKQNMVISVVHFGILFFLFSLILESESVFAAFGLQASVYAGLVVFTILYSPVSALLSGAINFLSRHNEFEADRYAVETTGRAAPLIQALKTLSLTNLGNLTPHPFYVSLTYSHPPLLQRIEGLRRAENELPTGAELA